MLLRRSKSWTHCHYIIRKTPCRHRLRRVCFLYDGHTGHTKNVCRYMFKSYRYVRNRRASNTLQACPQSLISYMYAEKTPCLFCIDVFGQSDCCLNRVHTAYTLNKKKKKQCAFKFKHESSRGLRFECPMAMPMAMSSKRKHGHAAFEPRVLR